jgi:hypothetical protein
MSELRQVIADTIREHVFGDDTPTDEAECCADAVMRVLAEHGDTEQVREQMAERVTGYGAHLEAAMTVIAPIVAARDTAVEKTQWLKRERDAAVERAKSTEWAEGLSEQHCEQDKHVNWFVDDDAAFACQWCRAERAEVDLAAARQLLDQVRAVAERQLSDQASGGDDKRGWAYAHDLLAILDAPTQPAERAEQQAELAKQWQSEYDEQTAHAARLSRELAAARQLLDQVRALINKWERLGWRANRAELREVLDAPARPTGHDETGQA